MSKFTSKSVVSRTSISSNKAQVFTGLEDLETRRLFASLMVDGTVANDTILLSQSAGKIHVNLNGTTTSYSAAAYTGINVNARAGNDLIQAANSVVKNMLVFGQAGNDTIHGGSAEDDLRGGDGNDMVRGGAGSDIMSGGNGVDTVDYSDRTENITVWLDALKNDGATGELDNAKGDIENVSTGSGNDFVVGHNLNNYISTGAGSDTVYGMVGNDTVYSGTGVDYVYGGIGNDWIYDGGDNGYLSGEDGNDTIYGGSGNPTLRGGTGNDYLSCGYGSGTSFVYGDSGDDTLRPNGTQAVVYGGDGNDDVNGYTSGTLWAYGEAGNDTLYGGYGQNVLYGEDGNDTVKGYGTKHNWLYGGNGDDIVKGSKSSGAIWNGIYGEAGNDSLFGGQGNDLMQGGDGDDTLVSIGGGNADTVSGGAGFDSFWSDLEATELVQHNDGFWDLLFEGAGGNVHRVGSFMRGVSRELLGQNLADPTDAGTTVNTSSQPLFSSAGPSKDDIDQGGLGDCGTMSTLGAIAKTNPNKIRQTVVDLGDGTYAAQFFSGGSKVFVRVDGDLATWAAGNGAQSSTWVRVMEKAFATFRSNTYASVASRWMSDVFTDLGATNITSHWSWSSGTDLLNKIATELAAGKAVTVSTDASGITGTCPCVANHAYMVERVNYTAVYLWGVGFVNIATSVTLRNPWGTDGAGNDGSNDGYVTVTAAEANDNFTAVMSGLV